MQEVCRLLVERCDGSTTQLRASAADGRELLRRVSELPGFGKQKAQILVALLGKQYSVQPEAAGEYGKDGSFRSVADALSTMRR